MFNTLRLVELYFHLLRRRRRRLLLSAESLIKQQQKNAIRKVKSRNCQAKLMCSQRKTSNFKNETEAEICYVYVSCLIAGYIQFAECHLCQ